MSSLLSKFDVNYSKYLTLSTNEEREIIINLIKLRSVLEKSMKTRTINEICEYLFELTSLFNTFYSNHEVLKEKDDEKKASYLALTQLVLKTNKYLLNILAIDVPAKI